MGLGSQSNRADVLGCLCQLLKTAQTLPLRHPAEEGFHLVIFMDPHRPLLSAPRHFKDTEKSFKLDKTVCNHDVVTLLARAISKRL
jgi:hypothetical protein